jgi:Uma2 family endonuclease
MLDTGLPPQNPTRSRADFLAWEADQPVKHEFLAGEVFYPDVMVSCDEAGRQRPLAIQAPCMVVEVLAESTAAHDLGAKFAAYRLLPSLQEYLLVDIERRSLEVFCRQAQGWVLAEPTGEPPVLHLHSVALPLTADDAFGDLDVEQPVGSSD